MITATNFPAGVQTPEVSIRLAAPTGPETEPELWSWKLSVKDVSPKSSLIEHVISVVFALMAGAIVIEGALVRFHLIGLSIFFQK